MVTTNFEDFYEVPNLNFDISRLRNDLDKILKAKKFNSPGVTHFGAISLNQIPNDKSSIEDIKFPELFDVLKLGQGVTNYADLSNIEIIRKNSASQGGGKISTKIILMINFLQKIFYQLTHKAY